MEIILSKNCLSLTGMLNTELGYYIRSTKKGKFYAQRSKHFVPPDGHWRFIVICAELAQNRLYMTDIKVTNRELFEALREANLPSPAFLNWNNVEIFNAQDILNLKTTFSL